MREKRNLVTMPIALLVLLAACDMPLFSQAKTIQSALREYNQVELSESAQLLPPDDSVAAAFKDYAFVCRKQSDHLPLESAQSRSAFERFVQDVRTHTVPDEDDIRRRRDLLNQAIEAGGWRARYFDAMWTIWLEPNSAEGRAQFEVLMDMVEEGNPAAIEGVLRWTGNMEGDETQRVLLQKAAMDAGNSEVMSHVGFSLGTRTRELRPKAIQMLECAAGQGNAEAYFGLGNIAWLEGRWVDAYRAWQQGANLGCDACLNKMEDIVLTRPDYKPSSGMFGQEPAVAALRKFYDSQFLYEISHLIELREPAPPTIRVQWSDEQIVATIRAHIRAYGLP